MAGRLPRAAALKYSCPGGVTARPGIFRVVNVPTPATVAAGVLVVAGVPIPALGVLRPLGEGRAVPTPGLIVVTNRSKRSSLGSYVSSSSHEYSEVGSMGERSEGKACAMMLGEVPTPKGDIMVFLVPPRTQPAPVSIESSP